MNLSVISAIARKLCEKVKNFFYQQPVYFPLIYKKIIKLPTLADEYSAPKNSTSTVPGYPHHLPEDKYPYPSTKRVPEDKYPYPGTKRVPDVGGWASGAKGTRLEGRVGTEEEEEECPLSLHAKQVVTSVASLAPRHLIITPLWPQLRNVGVFTGGSTGLPSKSPTYVAWCYKIMFCFFHLGTKQVSREIKSVL